MILDSDSSDFLYFSLREWPRLPFTARIALLPRDARDRRDLRDEPTGEGLIDLPLRASGDHRCIVGALRAQRPHQPPPHLLLRPRVARAQKIIRPHPLLCCLVPFTPYIFSRGWPGRSSIARVERAHSDRARSASKRTTRLPSLPLAVSRPTPYTESFAIQPGLNSPARSSIS